MGERSGQVGLALVVVAVALGAWMGSTQRPPPPPSAPAASRPHESVPVGTIRVHVAGWVAAPGVVSLPEGALAADAVAAAGGLLPGALADSVNLAAPVSDGTQLVVPGPGASLPLGDAGGGSGGGPVSVNRATASELEALPGVGPVLAGRIVAAVPGLGRGGREEGSVLGGLGRIIDGDN